MKRAAGERTRPAAPAAFVDRATARQVGVFSERTDRAIQRQLPFEDADQMFQRVFRELKPRTPVPQFEVSFHPYANLDSRIRLENSGRTIRVRMSDQLEQAPPGVQEALAHVLLSKLYRKPVEPERQRVYRSFVNQADVRRRALQVRRQRGRKRFAPPQGGIYDLDALFDELNRRFFQPLLRKPKLGWSERASRRLLGHYDPAHDAIVISRIFDAHDPPRFVLEYVLYHEMLHLKHPVEYRSERRCVHSADFRRDERLFPRYREAVQYLEQL